MSNAAQYRESVRIHPLQKRGDEPTTKRSTSGADLGGGCRGCVPSPEITCGFLIQMVFCKKKNTLWFIGVEVEQETSATPPKKNPGSAPEREQSQNRLSYDFSQKLCGNMNSSELLRLTCSG